MTVTILITDDEAPARIRLKQMLSDLSEYEVVGEACNGREALDLCQQLNPMIERCHKIESSRIEWYQCRGEHNDLLRG